jgi:serine/threonine protein kinase/tetratricopeptide (TPR) repeat protein
MGKDNRAMKCPTCQTENPSDSRYCKQCATPLHPSEKIAFSVTETLHTHLKELTTGSTFAGRYQVIEELGTGGMGKVYKVFDTEVKEKMALKLIKPEISLDQKTIERFRNELKTARKIRHKNICQMFDLSREEGAYYITMEYVPGEDLKNMIRMSKQLGLGTAVEIARQVCEGLAEAHRLGVIHRDLKPSNIMIDREGNVRIMDFGIARTIKERGITGEGVIIGTPEYMSPEQVEGKEVDQRSDFYSLGVILYEMLTGRVPFEGETPFIIGVKHKSEIPKDPREFNPQIPEDLSHVILQCLEKEKTQRYQSAGELRSALEGIEKGIPETSRIIPQRKPLTSREITVKFSLKKLFIPALVLAALVVIGVVLVRFIPRKETLPQATPKPSLAVLPFENYSDSKEDEYFSDGITEDITTQLSKISELQVCSRMSVMKYKKTTKGIREIGKELGVAAVLEGSVRRAANTVRVTAQLIDSNTDKQVWAEMYDREFKEIFMIQSDIAQQIAAALKATLTPAEKERVEKKPTKDIRAYEYYVKGREYYYRYKKEDNEQAIELFKKAIELDPDYALAHAGLADAYFQRVLRFGFPEAEWFEPAVEEAQKAISLDPNLSEGYKALGNAYGFGKGWWKKAGEAFQKAFEANPNNAVACLVVGQYYYHIGELDKAVPFIKKAIALSPASAFPGYALGLIYYRLDDRGQAEEWLKKALELQPDLDVAHKALIDLYLALGEYNKAIEQSQTYLSKIPGNPSAIMFAAQAELFSGHYEKAQEYYQKIGGQRAALFTGGYEIELGYIYWKAGRKGEARKLFQRGLDLLQKRLEQGDESYDIRVFMAAIYAVQGNKEEALRWLEKAIDAGWCEYNYASRYPLLENIRDDARFKQIIERTKAKVDEMRRRVEKEQK